MGQYTRILVVVLVLSLSWVLASAFGRKPKKECIEKDQFFGSPEALLKYLSSDEIKRCGQEYEEAFEQLKLVLADEVLEDICSEETYKRIRKFHTQFIHYYLPETSGEELKAQAKAKSLKNLKPIPVALRRFFIMFVKQINYNCKFHMVEHIAESKANFLDDADFKVIAKFEEDRKRFIHMDSTPYHLLKAATSVGKLDRFNDLEIIDLTQSVDSSKNGGSGDDDNSGAKLYLKVRFDDPLIQLKNACKKKFMPVYMELIAPVIKLNNLGYIERIKSSELLDEKIEDSHEHWFEIVETCEMMKDIEVVHDPTLADAVANMIQSQSVLVKRSRVEQAKSRKVFIITPQEYRNLQDKIKGAREVLTATNYDPEQLTHLHHPISFKPKMLVDDKRKIDSEISDFETDVNNFISERTSFARRMKDKLLVKIRSYILERHQAVTDGDDSFALGQMANFLNRHQWLVAGLGEAVVSIESPSGSSER